MNTSTFWITPQCDEIICPYCHNAITAHTALGVTDAVSNAISDHVAIEHPQRFRDTIRIAVV